LPDVQEEAKKRVGYKFDGIETRQKKKALDALGAGEMQNAKRWK
jgi:hypothetical protein